MSQSKRHLTITSECCCGRVPRATCWRDAAPSTDVWNEPGPALGLSNYAQGEEAAGQRIAGPFGRVAKGHGETSDLLTC